jgi:acyl-coenzyme A synthetase/AMP-(fatty) acid ligase
MIWTKGLPGPDSGMALKAIVVLAGETALMDEQIIRHGAQHPENAMAHRCVEFRAEPPKTYTGKIRRSEVQAEVVR